MSRQDPQTHVRLPAELKARIEQAAADNRRSITAELISRIEQSFERPSAGVISVEVNSNALIDQLTPEQVAACVEKVMQSGLLQLKGGGQ